MKDKHEKPAYYLEHRAERLAYLKRWRQEHRATKRAADKAWRLAHREQVKANMKRWHLEHREERWRIRLKEEFGITGAEYDAMLLAQGNVCAICERPERAKRWVRSRLVVDHDHDTGVVRGLLCSTCNLALGGFDDDPALLERAGAYLRHAEQQVKRA